MRSLVFSLLFLLSFQTYPSQRNGDTLILKKSSVFIDVESCFMPHFNGVEKYGKFNFRIGLSLNFKLTHRLFGIIGPVYHQFSKEKLLSASIWTLPVTVFQRNYGGIVGIGHLTKIGNWSVYPKIFGEWYYTKFNVPELMANPIIKITNKTGTYSYDFYPANHVVYYKKSGAANFSLTVSNRVFERCELIFENRFAYYISTFDKRKEFLELYSQDLAEIDPGYKNGYTYKKVSSSFGYFPTLGFRFILK